MFGAIEFGTYAGWATAGGVFTLVGIALRFLPRWVEVKAAQRASDHEIAKELRDELMGRLNDCEVKHNQMVATNEELMGRIAILEDGDRRKTIALTLLMNEVSRLDPTSDIIIRAKAVLELSMNFGPSMDKKMEQYLKDLEKRK